MHRAPCIMPCRTVTCPPVHTRTHSTPNAGAHPIYQTMHYVDDSLYVDDWKSTAKRLNRNPQIGYQNCATRLRMQKSTGAKDAEKEAIALCAKFVFTARGSKAVVALERSAVQEANISFYDTFAITRNQPLASKPGDGRHYIALLPKELVALSVEILAWLRSCPT